MFDRRLVTDLAMAALIAFPALLPSSFAPASARSAIIHSDHQSPEASSVALAEAARPNP